MACEVNKRRATMTDDEYWADVAESLQDSPVEPDPEDEDLSDEFRGYPTPCAVCGAYMACDYDSEGEPLIHAGHGRGED
jgi:hypothetical protein